MNVLGVSIVSIHADQSRLNNEVHIENITIKVSIVSIHADQSRRKMTALIVLLLETFQSYQFMQINPDRCLKWFNQSIERRFQSYQFMQINPDEIMANIIVNKFYPVSIVSIHADQSRLGEEMSLKCSFKLQGFNRINSCRSIPTEQDLHDVKPHEVFQSYQFMQINPDYKSRNFYLVRKTSFNRNNSCRSIPTLVIIPAKAKYLLKFQSYQFMQINPDNENGYWSVLIRCPVSIVSIHADQSRPVQQVKISV